MKELKRHRRLTIRKSASCQYLLYLPADYDAKSREGYPLLLFLHGAGERGSALDAVKVHGPARRIGEGGEFPFVVVAPQCPAGQTWDPYVLEALLDRVMDECRIDRERVYVTGLSMGGLGTWALANHCPEKLAAVAAICPPALWFAAERLRHVPVWCFHGAMDSVVPIEDAVRVVRNLRAAGVRVRFTVYPDADHDSWTATYDNPKFYDWLLMQRRRR